MSPGARGWRLKGFILTPNIFLKGYPRGVANFAAAGVKNFKQFFVNFQKKMQNFDDFCQKIEVEVDVGHPCDLHKSVKKIEIFLTPAPPS